MAGGGPVGEPGLCRPGAAFDEILLRDHVRAHLAGYKTPKRLIAVTKMFRAPNGKADYKSARDHALAALGTTKA
jgi:acyl-CoA synthetase (AMP-forming)/AMP-acid ligase II